MCGLVLLLLPGVGQAQKSGSVVVVTIRPLHALVAGVMGETGTPVLLLKGSPHDVQLRPSQAKALQDASVVFAVGTGLEPFFETSVDKTRLVTLVPGSDVLLLPRREGEVWGGEEEDAHDHHTHTTTDMHIWLDPGNAIRIVQAITTELASRFPEHTEAYHANARRLIARLEALDTRIKKVLRDVRGRPFIVFHDATQYVERAYGLQAMGAITREPEQPPAPRHMAALRAMLKERSIRCIVYEPEASERWIAAAKEGVEGVHTVMLDPLGSTLPEGEDAYFTMMEQLATRLGDCVK
ncbi:MAG: zinc ABC transporter substrate-binding protein [Rickettsiales bacterium]|nr:zinc ABC transporter substrate-binding protein [Rickettsiales bacterium]